MPRIVIIEDDGALRMDMAAQLTDWGHDVATACNASAGLQLIQDWRPDLVLCDINMPPENGFEVARRVRADRKNHYDMAFIFITAYPDANTALYASHCGADDFIAKPISYPHLEQKISANLRTKQGFVQKIGRMLVS